MQSLEGKIGAQKVLKTSSLSLAVKCLHKSYKLVRGCSQLQFSLCSAPTDYKAEVWTTEVTESKTEALNNSCWQYRSGISSNSQIFQMFSKQFLPVRKRSPSHWYMLDLPASDAKTWVNICIFACVYIMEPECCLKLSKSQFVKQCVQGNSIRSQSCYFSVGFLNLLRSQTLLRHHLIFTITCMCSWISNCRN